jgi:hypothetical protein
MGDSGVQFSMSEWGRGVLFIIGEWSNGKYFSIRECGSGVHFIMRGWTVKTLQHQRMGQWRTL